ncbi:ATP-binding protein [Streptomyces sp. NEAU-YJ-81]|uniref:ATP-binding protein n=1 Tax=Streptomyces sp. NEAU-YJ-81 TaxID=2820288 RepID=UPI001ABC081C|nr:ATP-binding protein [Streptomyces sp. NEAU-YJ-81]MBO3681418.1 ATP-binding protein [Streptomyces sp. NEAU-YJ-81]
MAQIGAIMYSATLPRTVRSAAIALLAEASQVRTARRFVAANLARWRVAEADRDRAELIVSELAGNAARHGGTDMTVHLSLIDRDIRVDVIDTGRSLVLGLAPRHPRMRLAAGCTSST